MFCTRHLPVDGHWPATFASLSVSPAWFLTGREMRQAEPTPPRNSPTALGPPAPLAVLSEAGVLHGVHRTDGERAGNLSTLQTGVFISSGLQREVDLAFCFPNCSHYIDDF